jgi:hypothetical protein
MPEATQWRPDQTRRSRDGETRDVRVRDVPCKPAAVAVGVGGLLLLFLALEWYRAWQDYSSIWVQARRDHLWPAGLRGAGVVGTVLLGGRAAVAGQGVETQALLLPPLAPSDRIRLLHGIHQFGVVALA